MHVPGNEALSEKGLRSLGGANSRPAQIDEQREIERRSRLLVSVA